MTRWVDHYIRSEEQRIRVTEMDKLAASFAEREHQSMIVKALSLR